MNFIYKIKRFFRKFEIQNIMTYIVIGMAAITVGDLLTGYGISSLLSFSRSAILTGQVWRIFTFLLLPLNYSLIWAAVSIVLYYSIGKELEYAWSSRKLTLYLLLAWVLTVIGGFISGYSSSEYIFLSLFLVYGTLMPHRTFNLFMVIPVSAKLLGIIDAVMMALVFISGSSSARLSVLAAFIAYLVFFGRDVITPVFRKIKFKAKQKSADIYQNRRSKITMTERKDRE